MMCHIYEHFLDIVTSQPTIRVFFTTCNHLCGVQLFGLFTLAALYIHALLWFT